MVSGECALWLSCEVDLSFLTALEGKEGGRGALWAVPSSKGGSHFRNFYCHRQPCSSARKLCGLSSAVFTVLFSSCQEKGVKRELNSAKLW